MLLVVLSLLVVAAGLAVGVKIAAGLSKAFWKHAPKILVVGLFLLAYVVVCAQ